VEGGAVVHHRSFFKHDQKSRVDDAIAKDAADDKIWREVCKVVDFRDKRRCRCCGKKTNPDDVGLLRGHRHHLVYRSAGGKDESGNLLTLCARCHTDEHQNRLQIHWGSQGADDCVSFWKKDETGCWFQWRREIAIGRFEKD
jgi:hypothetical protein